MVTQDDIRTEYHNHKTIIEEKRDALLSERFRTYNDLTVAAEAFIAFNDRYGDNDCDSVRGVFSPSLLKHSRNFTSEYTSHFTSLTTKKRKLREIIVIL